ncbi:MAG: hypothetical protein Q8Q17_02500 [bacterium]|nr:hypothetical protein [bacterium]
MKKYKFLSVFVSVLLVFAISQAAFGFETKVFKFKARTWDSISSNTDRLNGNYELVISNGKAEVFQLLDGQRVPIEGNAAAELLRMAGVDPDNRMYVDPSKLAIGKKWNKSYPDRTPWRTFIHRNVEYEVVGREQKITTAGTFDTFKIEGSAFMGSNQRKWVYYYAPDIKVIVHWNFDSAVGERGYKAEIEFVGFGS